MDTEAHAPSPETSASPTAVAVNPSSPSTDRIRIGRRPSSRLPEVLDTMRGFNEAKRFQETLSLYATWGREARKSPAFWTLVAEAQLALGYLTEAESAYRNVLTLNPACFEATLQIGSLLMQRGLTQPALHHFEAAYQTATPEQQTRLGEWRDLVQALLDAEHAVELHPTDPKTQYTLAVQRIDAGQLQTAHEPLRWLAKRKPEYAPQLYFQLGRIAAQRGLQEKAMHYYRAAFEQSDGTYLEALNNLAITSKAHGDLKSAIRALETALEKDPDYLVVRCNLGIIRMEQGQLDEALQHFQTITEQAPQSVFGWYHLGIAASRNQDFDRAIEAYQRTLQISPAHIQARLNLGVTLRQSGNLHGAIAQYLSLLQFQSEYTPAWFNLALAYQQAHMPEKAERAFARAANIKTRSGNIQTAWTILGVATKALPHRANLFRQLGNACLLLQRPSEAVAAYQQSLHLEPDHAPALQPLGQLLLQLGRLEPGLDAWRRFAKLCPRDYDHAYQLGKVLYRHRSYEEAAVQLSKAASYLTHRPGPDIWLGRAYEQLGLPRRAQTSYQKALDKDSKFVAAHLRLGDLARRKGDLKISKAWYHDGLQIDPEHRLAQKKQRHVQMQLLDKEATLDPSGPTRPSLELPTWMWHPTVPTLA